MTDETNTVDREVPPKPGEGQLGGEADTQADDGATQTSVGAPRRRRRRGGRGRGRSSAAASASGPPEGGLKQDAGDEGASAAPSEPDLTADTAAAKTDGPSGEVPARTTTRRRSRGGRGRGGRGRAAGTRASEAGQTEAGPVGGGAEPSEKPRPRPRPKVAEPETAEGAGIVAAVEGEIGEGAGSAGSSATRRRRRRGGRGRSRKRPTTAAADGDGAEAAEGAQAERAEVGEAVEPREEQAAPTGTRRRRSRARKAEAEEAAEEASPAKPRARRPTAKGATKAATKAPTKTATKVASTAGPTRLRRGRQATGGARRRREPMPVVPRVTDKVMVITEHGERDQIAILEERSLVQHYVTRAGARSMVGNVYLGRVQNVLPGMEAAFVDAGRGRNAVLYAGEVNYSPEDLEGKQAPRIEQVLKSGQSVLVQVTKDPIGGKGARLTAQISMPGRYLVLVPNSQVTGISRRLPDAERRRLRSVLKRIRPEGDGVIVRTAAEEAPEEALAEDVRRLQEEWASIEKRAKKAKAPAVLYEEPELTVRVVRDLFTDEEYRELVTDSERVYTLVTEYLASVASDLLPKVRLHTGKLPVFEEFHVVEQIHKGLDRKVWLPSGGYLVIDRTEAMTVIDVNTGKSVGKTNLEETVVNTNIEAAREVARQLRLRDIGGMIIIDFIDMLLEQNKKRVVDTLREEMARDKTRSQVFDISPLGLLEVTRKRVSGGLLESFSETCPTCEGRGVILTYEA